MIKVNQTSIEDVLTFEEIYGIYKEIAETNHINHEPDEKDKHEIMKLIAETVEANDEISLHNEANIRYSIYEWIEDKFKISMPYDIIK